MNSLLSMTLTRRTEIGEWDSALEIIDTYQNTYGQNEAMAEAYATLRKSGR